MNDYKTLPPGDERLPPELAATSPPLTYPAWRITFQSSESAARAAWHEWCRVAARENHIRGCLRDARALCAHYAQLLFDTLHHRRTIAPGPVLVNVGWSDGREEMREYDHWPERAELPADAVRFDIAWPDLKA